MRAECRATPTQTHDLVPTTEEVAHHFDLATSPILDMRLSYVRAANARGGVEVRESTVQSPSLREMHETMHQAQAQAHVQSNRFSKVTRFQTLRPRVPSMDQALPQTKRAMLAAYSVLEELSLSSLFFTMSALVAHVASPMFLCGLVTTILIRKAICAVSKSSLRLALWLVRLERALGSRILTHSDHYEEAIIAASWVSQRALRERRCVLRFF